MAIKKLQNNFTTLEQSKRLLELGIPAVSADLYYFTQDSDIPLIQRGNGVSLYPCWSVGRLEEILCICNKENKVGDFWPTHTTNMQLHNLTQIEYLITWATNCKELLDFSKLED